MKKRISLILCLLMAVSVFAGCSAPPEAPPATVAQTPAVAAGDSLSTDLSAKPSAAESELKYIFMFIGDGMSYPQIQTAADYLGALADNNDDGILDGQVDLPFMEFPVAGSAVTYDSTSFCPDSASTATSLASGHKTYSGVINMDETLTTPFSTIAEELKEQKDFRVGIISTVNLNHATPAAYYAHQPSRNNYYDIGLELISSEFEYFAGGALLQPTGKDEDKTDIYEVANTAGYKVVKTQAEAEAVSAASGKVIIIDEHLADANAMAYEIDRSDDMWSLASYVEKGIEVLNNDTGFFMMVEGGKIDWACHANDASASIGDTIALADAVQVAIDFAKEHPDETLILVTGDHETGGLTIGFAGTDYDTYLTNLVNQKISYAKYDSDYVSAYKANNTGFDTVMQDITALFGLKTSGEESDKLVMTEYELGLLKEAYAQTMDAERAKPNSAQQAEYVLYGTYEPLTVTITHILNNKSGISFSSYAHTGLPVAVFAQGNGQEEFEGYYNNTDVYHKLAELTGIK